MDTRFALPINTELDGCYRIVRMVGSGGFGITYEAEDMKLGITVAIKEYYPADFGDRDRGMSVRPRSERHRSTFAWGRVSFLEEARTLARFEHPCIVGVSRVFEANSTAYMVMRFERGQSLEAWLSTLGRPPLQEELDRILFPLLDALDLIHKGQFLHRDIAPDNIIVRTDGTPVLLDFGAARAAMANRSRSLTGLVKPGFSPLEQYAGDGRLQGPWSDLYALGGTMYRAVTGRVPDEASLRVDDDRTPPAAQAAKAAYRTSFLAAIDACLAVSAAERPQSAGELRAMLLRQEKSRPRLERIAEALKAPGKPDKPSRPQPLARTRRSAPSSRPAVRRLGWFAAAGLLTLAGVAYGSAEFALWRPGEPLWNALQLQEAADAQEARRIATLEEQSRKESDLRAEETAEAYEKIRLAALHEASRIPDSAPRPLPPDEAAGQGGETGSAPARPHSGPGNGDPQGGASKKGNDKGKHDKWTPGRRPKLDRTPPHYRPPGSSTDVAAQPPLQGVR